MREHKIFKPDLLFQDYIRSAWSQNIKTVEGKIPINSFLKERRIFALDIDPNPKENLYMFALPINKNWEAETFSVDSRLSFEIYSEDQISIDLLFKDSQEHVSPSTKIIIGDHDTDLWKKFSVPILTPKDLRLILFSGSPDNTPNYVIKDIVIETN